MSNYLKKSSDNLKAAELLNNKKIYAPAVHCAYYSCLLRMKHTLVYILKISESVIEEESKKLGGSIHQFAPNNIFRAIHARNKEKASDFLDYVRDLKTFRITSDYKDLAVGNSESVRSIALARDINKILEENTGVKAS